jgi:hypothetical protein
MYVLMRHPEYGTVHKVGLQPIGKFGGDPEKLALRLTTVCGISSERLVRPRLHVSTDDVADCKNCCPELRDPHQLAPERRLLPRWERERLALKET